MMKVANLERNSVNLRNLTAAVTFTTSSQSCHQNPGNDECVTQYNLCYYILKFLRNHPTFLSVFENQKEKLREKWEKFTRLKHVFLLLFTSDLTLLMKQVGLLFMTKKPFFCPH